MRDYNVKIKFEYKNGEQQVELHGSLSELQAGITELICVMAEKSNESPIGLIQDIEACIRLEEAGELKEETAKIIMKSLGLDLENLHKEEDE